MAAAKLHTVHDNEGRMVHECAWKRTWVGDARPERVGVASQALDGQGGHPGLLLLKDCLNSSQPRLHLWHVPKMKNSL